MDVIAVTEIQDPFVRIGVRLGTHLSHMRCQIKKDSGCDRGWSHRFFFAQGKHLLFNQKKQLNLKSRNFHSSIGSKDCRSPVSYRRYSR
jgi:hypothetical protein